MALNSQPSKLPSSNVSSTFKELAKTAQALNSASDNLNKVIEKLGEALRILNIGVAAWVSFDQWSDEEMNNGYSSIGYAKINNRWGITLTSTSGNDQWPEERSMTWHFSDAPRELRLRAVRHIPELIEELNKVAAKFTEDLLKKTSEAGELANAISAASNSSDAGTEGTK
jgi:hypothetical protein